MIYTIRYIITSVYVNGGAITIINTSDCITDYVLLLNDTKAYQTTSCEIIDKHVTEAENLVKTLADSNRQIIHDLLPDQPRACISLLFT